MNVADAGRATFPYARSQENPRKPRVILIAGFPNSGTTIVSYLLSQHPEVFASGELVHFPVRQLKPTKMCSCGSPAATCPFWSEVLARLGDLRHAVDAVKMPALYRIICAMSGARVVVDVAHDLHAVRSIRALDGIDLSLVHLSRRPMAVLRSRLALNCRQGELRPYTFAYAWRALTHGRRLHTYERRLGACVRADAPAALRASYEEICQLPAAPLSRIGRLCGLDFSAVTARLEGGEPLRVPAHMIRGNARLRSKSSVRLVAR
ncbi:MAG: hypothetical protein U1E66_14310 [Rhodospirillales bacterium]